MAACPECRAVHPDDVRACPEHGCALVPAELLPPDDMLKPGTMVGEYRIDRKLGAGTFGEVYAGEHPLIGKKVAVKVLNRRFASDPQMVSRFVAEARAVNKIRQRNIIDIFAFGVIPDLQRHYFVMELCDGLTLGALLDRERRLPVATVLSIVQGIADALDAVHEAGITHRDLKPDNVFLVTERRGTYFPKLLDFGIAKLIDDELAHKTGSGLVLGTPRYMSPEQARGRKAEPMSDIYALGVMIHEMLTGKAPFSGDSAVDVLLKHTTDPPPPMSTICPDLPAELDAPVLAMLAKRPRDRPKTAGEAVAAFATTARDLGLDRLSLPADSGASGSASSKKPYDGVTVRVAVPAATPPTGGSKPDLRLLPGETDDTIRVPPSDVGSPRPPEASDSPRPSAEPPSEALPAVSTSSTGTRAASQRRLWMLGAGAAAVAAGVFVLAFGRSSQPPPPAGGIVLSMPGTTASALAPHPTEAARSAPATATPVEGATTVTAAATALPATVELHLITHPPDVEVWLGDQKLGTSGKRASLPRGTERVALRLKKTGFKDERVEVVPDRDQSIEASLAPVGAPSRPAGKGAPDLDKVLGGRD